MKRWVAIVVVVAQLGVLAFMAGEREWVLRTGRTVFLRTAPVDPRDPMRGDYVRFNYEITNVPKALCRDGVVAWTEEKPDWRGKAHRDERVYALVKPDGEGVAELVSLTDRKPEKGVFLRGRVDRAYEGGVDVRFGVEVLFMQQGKAREFENVARGPKSGVPLNIEVVVSDGGLAVAKGFRWEPLGISILLDRPAADTQGRATGTRQREEQPGLRGATVELKNHSDKPVAVVNRPEGGSFRLVQRPNRWDGTPATWKWTGEGRVLPVPTADQVKVLKPGESLKVHLDFTASEWFVQKYGKGVPVGEAVSLETLRQEWNVWFRIEYVPPTAAECARLPHAELVRHSKLATRAFTPAGGAD